MNMPTVTRPERSRKRGYILLVAIIAPGLAFILFLARDFIKPPDRNRNVLAIKDRATEETVWPAIHPLADLNFKTKSEVLDLRRQAVTSYSRLIVGDYRPSEAVFGQIVDHAPWWGMLGAYLYGPGEKSILGPSMHSGAILNPYLLVVPWFRFRWDEAAIKEVEEQGWSESLHCPPRRLRWYPRSGRAEVTYQAECLARHRVRFLDLVAFNARDLGLNYIYVSYANSRNVCKETPPRAAYNNPQFIHKGGSCGYTGGCNNMSPRTPDIDRIEIIGWPAKLVTYLWTDNPRSVGAPPDMEYIMHFE